MIFLHIVVEDDTFVCLNYGQIALKTTKAICNSLHYLNSHGQELMVPEYIQSPKPDQGRRKPIWEAALHCWTVFLIPPANKSPSQASQPGRAELCLSHKRNICQVLLQDHSEGSPCIFAYSCWAEEFRDKQARTRQMNWFIEVLYNSRVGRLSQ